MRVALGPEPERAPKSNEVFCNYIVTIFTLITLNISKPNSKFLERIKRILFRSPRIQGFQPTINGNIIKYLHTMYMHLKSAMMTQLTFYFYDLNQQLQ